MTTPDSLRSEELKKEFIETQCEPDEDSERYSVYENDGELVADWWLQRIDEILASRAEMIRGICCDKCKEVIKSIDAV